MVIPVKAGICLGGTRLRHENECRHRSRYRHAESCPGMTYSIKACWPTSRAGHERYASWTWIIEEEYVMPLRKGSSHATVSSNIKTLVHDYEKTGAIGTSKPASKKKAIKQAVAIALDKARDSGGKKG